MSFDINQVDPGKVIEVQQDELARIVKEKMIINAQANMALERVAELENANNKLEGDLGVLRVELESLKKAMNTPKRSTRKASTEVIDGELAD